MGNNAIFEEIFWPQKVGGVSFSLQQYSYKDLIGVINGYKVYLGICTAHSKRRKNDLCIQSGWNVTLFG